MIEVHYFASIRETLNTEVETIELPEEGCSVADVIDHLVDIHGGLWAKTLRETSVLIAINQTVAKLPYEVNDGDELAFFPPVTGG